MQDIDLFLIDDDPFMEKIFKSMLNEFDLNFKFCSDAEKGLDEVVQQKPKVLVLDYNMPGLNGQEMIVKLSENHVFQYTSIYLLTGEVMDEMQKLRLMTLGFTKLLL